MPDMQGVSIPSRTDVCLWVLIMALPSGQLPAQTPIEVTLTSSSKSYVLGEPVAVTVSVKNVLMQPIKARRVFVDLGEPEITLYLAKEGQSFQQYAMGFSSSGSMEGRGEFVLQPGESTQYTIRMVHARRPWNPWAFGHLGRYRIKASYPLNRAGGRHEPIESNAIEVEIKQPEGVDAIVWQTIRRPGFPLFLQDGWSQPAHPDIPASAMSLLERIPDSVYHEALRYALTKYYERRWAQYVNRADLDAEEHLKRELETLRSALGMGDPFAGPFLEDRRLDVVFVLDFPKMTPLEEVYKQVSQATGVALRAAPEFSVRSLGAARRRISLREFMRNEVAAGEKWIPYEGGYLLTP